MAGKRDFEIAFVGLKPGVHVFEYDLQADFFKERGLSEADDIEAKVKLDLDRHQGFLLLKFHVGGTAAVNCDRCGNPIRADLWDEFNVVVKMVDEPEEMNENEEDPDVFYISRTESHIDVKDWLYEFALLSIPLQKRCGTDEKGRSLCNPDVLKKLDEMKKEADEHNAGSLWKGLEKFKDN